MSNKMSRKERDELAAAIESENHLLGNLTRMARNSFVTFAICLVIDIWGFTGMKDALFPNINHTVRTVISWIALVIGVICLVIAILSLIARHNGRKSVLYKINKYQGRDPFDKCKK